MPRLPFTEEIAVLKERVAPARVRILEGFEAAPQTLGTLNLTRFAILHFSTHAFIDDRIPELSRVVLSLVDRAGRPINGYLYPHHFAGLRLNGSIVVLSSCDTGLGKEVLGEGLAGFATSLISAGASQLVLTLTQVDAEASAVFFAEVYRRLFGSQPMSMETAIRRARRTLAASSRWRDPYYWASFTIVGSYSAQ